MEKHDEMMVQVYVGALGLFFANDNRKWREKIAIADEKLEVRNLGPPCLEAWQNAQGTGIMPTEWVQMHRQQCSLFTNVDALDRIVALPKSKSLAAVAPELKIITKQSELGRRLFGHCAAPMHSEKLATCLAELEKKLVAEPVLEQVTLQKHKRIILEEMVALMGQESGQQA